MCVVTANYQILVFIILYGTIIFSKEFEKGLNEDTNSRKRTSIIEVSCTLFSVFYECSNTFNNSGEVYSRFSNECRILSAGTKYIRSKCDKNTMVEVLTYFREKSLPNEDGIMDWNALMENPSSIANFVMSIMFNSKVFHRSRQIIQKAINKLKQLSGVCRHCGDDPPTRTIRHKNQNRAVEGGIILELSCTIFTISKDCSYQFPNCSEHCRQLSIICDELSFGSKLFSMTCSKDTISELISMYRKDIISSYAYKLKDTDYIYFWRDIITGDPVDFVHKIITEVLKSDAYQLEVESLMGTTNGKGIHMSEHGSQNMAICYSGSIWIQVILFKFLVYITLEFLI